MSRLSVDIGGTFTDVVLENRGLASLKVLTTPESPEEGAIAGIVALLDLEGVSLDSVTTVIHGTTLATNALIERRGARTALVTTKGFRDILEMAYEKRFDQYDTDLQLPAPLVPRDLRLVLRERMDAAGQVLEPPDEADVEALARKILDREVEAVAVGLLHASANPDHERRVGGWLRARLPDEVTICLSSEVSPEIREYERFSTVAANAYVRPLMSRYLHRFDAALRDRGFGGEFFLMLSGGGLTTLDQAARTPIRLVESGPAGGVALGSQVARAIGADRLLAFDMGGTTAKICFLDNARPATSRRFEVARAWRDMKGSGLPVRIPTTELVEIGAGGGSIAARDRMGRLAVGPESAGSVPGPAAYARGGTAATITDANVVLGKLRPEGFAGGTIALCPDLAGTAIEKGTDGLGFTSTIWAAAGVVEIGEEAMANAARVHAIEQGKDVSRYTLMASGGAGPLHAARIAEKLGIGRVVIPANAGVGSAVGFLAAPVAYEVARSVLGRIDRLDLGALAALQDDMAAEARGIVEPALAAGDSAVVKLAAELQYEGQGHTIRVALRSPIRAAGDVDGIVADFEAAYERVYGTLMPGNPIELVAVSLTAEGAAPPSPDMPAAVRPHPAKGRGSADVFDPASGTKVTAALHPLDGLAAGATLDGPFLATGAQTTAYAPPGWQGRVHEAGHLILTRGDRP